MQVLNYFHATRLVSPIALLSSMLTKAMAGSMIILSENSNGSNRDSTAENCSSLSKIVSGRMDSVTLTESTKSLSVTVTMVLL